MERSDKLRGEDSRGSAIGERRRVSEKERERERERERESGTTYSYACIYSVK